MRLLGIKPETSGMETCDVAISATQYQILNDLFLLFWVFLTFLDFIAQGNVFSTLSAACGKCKIWIRFWLISSNEHLPGQRSEVCGATSSAAHSFSQFSAVFTFLFLPTALTDVPAHVSWNVSTLWHTGTKSHLYWKWDLFFHLLHF